MGYGTQSTSKNAARGWTFVAFNKRVLVDRAGARECGHDTTIDHGHYGQRIAGLNIIEEYGESLYIFAVFFLLFSTLRRGLWLAIVVPKSQTGFQVPHPFNLD